MVEPQPSKLMVRVRFPSPAPLRRPRCSVKSRFSCAHVAQSVEHLLGKEEVDGSIPFVSTTIRGVPAQGPAAIAGSPAKQSPNTKRQRDRQPCPRVSSDR